MSGYFVLLVMWASLHWAAGSPHVDALPDVTNHFIVGFKSHVPATDMQPALQRLAAALTPSVEPSTAHGEAPSGLAIATAAAAEPFQVLRILSRGDAAADATAQASSAAAASGPVVLLRLADPAASDLLRARHDVAFVLQDAIITAASEVPSAMASPVPTASALPAQAGRVTGGTGRAASSGLCVPINGTKATASTPVKLRQPVPCGNGTTDTLTYQGRTCGQGVQSVRWISATGPDGCTIKRQGSQQQLDKEVFGNCGIAPWSLAVPGSLGVRACPPVPAELPPPVCPRQAPPASATLPSGVVQIEAFRAGRVANPVAPGLAKVVVGIMATGIEERPDDYTLAGGRSWVNITDNSDTEDPTTDVSGFTTHYAGIVAAKGSAIVGVAPGVPLFSLKFLTGKYGEGTISNMLEAAAWAAGPEAAEAGIKVLLAPFGIGVSPSGPLAAWRRTAICGAMAKLEAAGVLVVAAAANQLASFRLTLPAACPTVLVATGEPIISSWLPTGNLTVQEAARVVSAPGLNINSTFPNSTEWPNVSGYERVSGTGGSAAHVAGVAANCVASGACSTSGPAAWRKLIVQAAVERATSYSPIFGAAHNPRAGDRFYGYALWSKW